VLLVAEGIEKLQDAIALKQGNVDSLSAKITRARTDLSRLETDANLAKAELQGLKNALEIITPVDSNAGTLAVNVITPSSASTTAKRMRLGPKKRVVFALIRNGISSAHELSRRLKDSLIDDRFINDCVRKAVLEEEISKDSEGVFSLSDTGNELLEKAPLPKEWDQFKDLVTKSLNPSHTNAPTINPEAQLEQFRLSTNEEESNA
jgi:predicted nuclease with TOPRIM domain